MALWHSDYPYTEFSSVDELCRLIDHATEGWDTRWYRGVKSPTYRLLPKLFRTEGLTKREGYISVEFRRRARSQLANINTQFEWLCAMQHFGIPTRLLDWSESLSVALFFTIRPIGLDLIAPTIWVLDPFGYQAAIDPQVTDVRIPIADEVHVIANSDIAFDELSSEKQKWRTNHPIPVVPDFVFQRLALQNGAFTIHGNTNGALESFVPEKNRSSLLKFVARDDKLDLILPTLDRIIPSSDAIFPDIEGLKDYIV
jgi:FRG domain